MISGGKCVGVVCQEVLVNMVYLTMCFNLETVVVATEDFDFDKWLDVTEKC